MWNWHIIRQELFQLHQQQQVTLNFLRSNENFSFGNSVATLHGFDVTVVIFANASFFLIKPFSSLWKKNQAISKIFCTHCFTVPI